MSDKKPARREFLGVSLASLFALSPVRQLGSLESSTAPDESWLRGLDGKHRQFFDVGSIAGGAPLRRVHNFVATYVSAYSLTDKDVNAVFGAHGGGLGFVLGDSAWAKYDLGSLYGVRDPGTNAPAVRNVFIDVPPGIGLRPEAGIRALQARGVRFLACNNTIVSLSEQLAARSSAKADDVRVDLVASIIPSAMIVPAMLIAGNRAQESGLTYAAL
jgi:intracellular sulfur oxidation DsrE/DsrF family protein